MSATQTAFISPLQNIITNYSGHETHHKTSLFDRSSMMSSSSKKNPTQEIIKRESDLKNIFTEPRQNLRDFLKGIDRKSPQEIKREDDKNIQEQFNKLLMKIPNLSFPKLELSLGKILNENILAKSRDQAYNNNTYVYESFKQRQGLNVKNPDEFDENRCFKNMCRISKHFKTFFSKEISNDENFDEILLSEESECSEDEEENFLFIKEAYSALDYLIGKTNQERFIKKGLALRMFIGLNKEKYRLDLIKEKQLNKRTNSLTRNFRYVSSEFEKKKTKNGVDLQNYENLKELNHNRWLISPMEFDKLLADGKIESKREYLLYQIRQKYEKVHKNQNESDYFEDKYVIECDQDVESSNGLTNRASKQTSRETSKFGALLTPLNLNTTMSMNSNKNNSKDTEMGRFGNYVLYKKQRNAYNGMGVDLVAREKSCECHCCGGSSGHKYDNAKHLKTYKDYLINDFYKSILKKNRISLDDLVLSENLVKLVDSVSIPWYLQKNYRICDKDIQNIEKVEKNYQVNELFTKIKSVLEKRNEEEKKPKSNDKLPMRVSTFKKNTAETKIKDIAITQIFGMPKKLNFESKNNAISRSFIMNKSHQDKPIVGDILTSSFMKRDTSSPSQNKSTPKFKKVLSFLNKKSHFISKTTIHDPHQAITSQTAGVLKKSHNNKRNMRKKAQTEIDEFRSKLQPTYTTIKEIQDQEVTAPSLRIQVNSMVLDSIQDDCNEAEEVVLLKYYTRYKEREAAIDRITQQKTIEKIQQSVAISNMNNKAKGADFVNSKTQLGVVANRPEPIITIKHKNTVKFDNQRETILKDKPESTFFQKSSSSIVENSKASQENSTKMQLNQQSLAHTEHSKDVNYSISKSKKDYTHQTGPKILMNSISEHDFESNPNENFDQGEESTSPKLKKNIDIVLSNYKKTDRKTRKNPTANSGTKDLKEMKNVYVRKLNKLNTINYLKRDRKNFEDINEENSITNSSIISARYLSEKSSTSDNNDKSLNREDTENSINAGIEQNSHVVSPKRLSRLDLNILENKGTAGPSGSNKADQRRTTQIRKNSQAIMSAIGMYAQSKHRRDSCHQVRLTGLTQAKYYTDQISISDSTNSKPNLDIIRNDRRFRTTHQMKSPVKSNFNSLKKYDQKDNTQTTPKAERSPGLQQSVRFQDLDKSRHSFNRNYRSALSLNRKISDDNSPSKLQNSVSSNIHPNSKKDIGENEKQCPSIKANVSTNKWMYKSADNCLGFKKNPTSTKHTTPLKDNNNVEKSQSQILENKFRVSNNSALNRKKNVDKPFYLKEAFSMYDEKHKPKIMERGNSMDVIKKNENIVRSREKEGMNKDKVYSNYLGFMNKKSVFCK